jgi:hypothetical protein
MYPCRALGRAKRFKRKELRKKEGKRNYMNHNILMKLNFAFAMHKQYPAKQGGQEKQARSCKGVGRDKEGREVARRKTRREGN